MLDLKFIASVAERDIDFLLLEELSASAEFRQWISARVFGEPIFHSLLGAWHSVSDAELGESDIIFLFEAIDGARTAVLIENKIDATPQPKQGERYQMRGKKGIKEGYWDTYKACLIAPEKYLSSARHSETYDAEITYEEILAYFQSRCLRDDRFSYKAKIVLEGIEQNRRGYQPEYNEEITKFVADYHSFAADEYSYLNMQEAKPRPAGSAWVVFYPDVVPKELSLVHQLTAGFVKVFFYSQAQSFENIKNKYSSKLPPGASIEISGKSVAISIKVPKIDPNLGSFLEQKDKAIKALQCLSDLAKVVSDGAGTFNN